MSIFWAILFLVGGLAILWKCAQLLVSGAVAVAQRLGISPLVIGLTVVAMGTSAPEVAASIAAAVRGAGDVAVGNVYGSNIANLALVGGFIALLRPLRLQARTVRYEIPAMIMVALLLYPLLASLTLSRSEGVFLLSVFTGLIGLTVYLARREAKLKSSAAASTLASMPPGSTGAQSFTASTGMYSLFILIGFAGLAIGADLTIRGAVTIGKAVGLSQAVIGLTVIAVGTSLPELVTCIAASLKKADDISVGNLVGSNIFNTLLVLGTAGIACPFEITARLAGTDYWIMVGISAGFALLAVLGRKKIGRVSGALLLFAYISYISYLLVCRR